MSDHAQHLVAVVHGFLHCMHDGMASFDRVVRVDIQVHIDHQHVTHLAGTQILASAGSKLGMGSPFINQAGASCASDHVQSQRGARSRDLRKRHIWT